MADINRAARGACHKPGKDHAFQHEVRVLREKFAVFKRARLALVGIADDIFFVSLGMPDIAPLLVRRHARAPHASQIRSFELLNHSRPVAGSHKQSPGLVWRWAVVGIDSPRTIGV